MGIRFVLLVNKQGQTRLAQCYEHLSLDERRALEGEIIRKCLARTDQQCSFVEHRNYKVVYRRYASLFFLVGVDNDEASDRFCTCMLFSIFHEELGTCKPSWYTSWCASSVYIFMIAFMLLPHQNLIFSGQVSYSHSKILSRLVICRPFICNPELVSYLVLTMQTSLFLLSICISLCRGLSFILD
ncbi:AP-1 complex subunit sigma-1-like isoform X2 [Hordeum vulgare subsp. vulgare]|uniref:AP-1 complex subunit sigma-1-like isoform X2 n=1 Tax=Hordeum vulgare subsp. vulgare TaxID=112509 RepID=UPI001D1A42B6|nr:AP-1 complex subunit sigma-1-like isoform X2 [Hordeum vulgare subsp. vulgare]